MAKHSYKYVIVGGGRAGASAAAGIREVDQDGSILLFTEEPFLPYNRPPLSKQLWTGKKPIEQIFIHPEAYYANLHVDLVTDAEVVGLNADNRIVSDNRGHGYSFHTLLLATGSMPRVPDIPGADLEGICYYRTLKDFQALHSRAVSGATAVVIGGGFLGTEMTAALTQNQVQVALVYPEPMLQPRLFPPNLSRFVQDEYRRHGVMLLPGDAAVAFTRNGDKFTTHTRSGKTLTSDIVLVGIGVEPRIALAQLAHLATDDGIVVNESLQTEVPAVFAAGDVANFHSEALEKRLRIEHWDNAMAQGKVAGINMTGSRDSYTYLPYFFSDLFDHGYEAIGEIDTRMEVFADWKEENKKGVIYYLRDNRVRGVLLWNVWDKVRIARELIQSKRPMTSGDLRGAIG
ncbi:MAG TPA: FAD-dependent oxidoreductase [Armatimonadota bacterium]|jgi:NADPH-dependent 2,4-dienoyl-CoA reductase/sulfur reductase-like enzyme